MWDTKVGVGGRGGKVRSRLTEGKGLCRVRLEDGDELRESFEARRPTSFERVR